MAANATLPTPAEAFDLLHNDVYSRAFFHKMAMHGYQPRDANQADEMLKLAGNLRIEQEKMAAAAVADDPFRLLNNHLTGVTTSTKQAAAQRQDELSFAKIAAEFAAVPEYFNAVLALKAAEAEAIINN